MAVDSKFFNIPFATSGDKATIPEAVQPSGAISFTQGFGPDYERDPATDPLAKRVPRDETNELYYEITLALKYLQLYGTPQYTAVADGGPANYPITARVRYDAGAGMQAWVSLVATNTAVPGSDATKWALDTAFSLTALEATIAEAVAGTIGTKLITPRRAASAGQQNLWTYAAAGGTAGVITATFAPALTAYIEGVSYRVKMASDCAGSTTVNFNGLGAVALTDANGAPLNALAYLAGSYVDMTYDGAKMRVTGGTLAALGTFLASTTATQSVGNNNPTVLAFATAGGSNNVGTYTTTAFTFTRPGVYAISSSLIGGLTFTGTTGTSGYIELRKNAVVINGSHFTSQSSQASPVSFPASNTVIISMVAGDILTVIGDLAAASGFTAASFTSVTLTITPLS